MPILPGLVAMPTTLLNAALGLLREDGLVVRGPDRLAVVSPMFEEEDGAGPALASLLTQWRPADQIAVSINGGRDRTADVVAATLARFGYERDGTPPHRPVGARAARWRPPGDGPSVIVLEHGEPTSKADGVNAVVSGGFVDAERILVVDGDTRFDPDFVRALRDGFYRLRLERVDGRRRYVLEDLALQSGAVESLRPGPGHPLAGLISRARSGEYALAALLRRGQTRRVGRGRVFGASRLYTAVGCGFAARRDAFPMPAETLTEDHDFSLRIQNDPVHDTRTDVRTLDVRGFRVVVEGREVPLSGLLDRDDEIVLRRGSDACFVTGARMHTEDPTGPSGYVRQVERWIGGGLENVLVRTVDGRERRSLRPNVGFTVWAAQLENLLGLLLLLMLPGALAVRAAFPDLLGVPLAGLGTLVALDLLATVALVLAGLAQLDLAHGYRGAHLLRRVARGAAASVVPLMLLKGVNALCYLSALTRVLPTFARRRRGLTRTSLTWVRPRAARAGVASARFALVATGVVALEVGAVAGIWTWAEGAWPGYRETARLVNAFPRLDQDAYRSLPVALDVALAEEAVAPGDGRPAGRTAPDVRVWLPSPLSLAAGTAMSTSPLVGGAGGAGPVGVPPPPSLGAAAGAAPVTPSGTVPAVASLAVASPAAAEPDGEATATLATAGRGGPAVPAATPRAAATTGGRGGGTEAGVSRFCRPDFLARPASPSRRLGTGADAGDYRPLTAWETLTLARLVPLLAHLEEAATAYDVPAELLLGVLLNESYLDPLAVGPTGDLGLSQVTSDALTMLNALSTEPDSPYANPHLFPASFSVFDPDFSICAGAAKLAWARAQPGGEEDAFAYARYINPLHGVARGRVSATHEPLVAALAGLEPIVDRLAVTVAAHRARPSALAPAERELLRIADAVASGRIDLATAYRRTAGVAEAHGVDDGVFYDAVLGRLFDVPEEAGSPDERGAAAGG